MNITQQNALWQALNSNFSEAVIVVANYFFSRARSNPLITVSYETIAKQVKIKKRNRICRETVRRSINKLIELGILKRLEQKFHMGACTFRVDVRVFNFAEQFKLKFKSFFRYLAIRAITLWKPNVAPLYKYSIYNKPRISIVVDNQSSTEVKRGNFLTKGNEVDISPPNITPTLREITDRLHLSRLGQLKLLVIPDDILSSVWSHYKKLSGINQPFDWLMANSLRRAENLGIAINWELFHLSVKRYGLVDNKKYIVPRTRQELDKNSSQLESRRSVDNIVRPHQDKKEPHPAFAKYFEIAMAHSSES